MTRPGLCEPWPADTSCCDLPDDVDPADVERWRLVASTVLWRLSGMRWGPSCPVTVRPCGRSCVEQQASLWPGVLQSGGRVPYMDAGGVWRNAVCGCKTASCSCTELCELRLDGPVYDVVEAVQDGRVLPPEAYRVDAPNTLVRLDGDCWPACQDLTVPPTEEDTAAVTYRTGLQLDEAAKAAVGALLCHYVRDCGSGCGCRIPKTATRVVRQGLEIETPGPLQLYEGGLTGVPMADAWLLAVNPYGQRSPSRVWSPDLRRPRVSPQWP